MKRTFNNKPIQWKTILSVFIITCLTFSTCFAQGSWDAVGTSGFSAGTVNYIDFKKAPDGTLYVAYQDANNSNKTTVMKYNGTTWVVVGVAGFSTTASYQQLAIDNNGTPYVAYRESTNFLQVSKFNGTSWVNVGSLSTTCGEFINLGIDSNNNLYLGYDDLSGYSVSVQKYDGSSWAYVGGAGFAFSATYVSMAVSPDGEPYVAYRDNNKNGKITLKKFDGSNWTDVGNTNFSNDYTKYTTLAFDNKGVPYVAYTIGEVVVRKLVGDTWTKLGALPASENNLQYLSLAFDPLNTPYVSYYNLSQSTGYVGSFDCDFSWRDSFASGYGAQSRYQKLIFGNDGYPYLAYKNSSSKAAVSKHTAIAKLCASHGGAAVTSGSTINLGTAKSLTTTITLTNVGHNTLDLTGTPLVEVASGTAFVVNTQPATANIAMYNALTFTITYTSSGVGNTDNGQITIKSNDSYNSTYTINLTAKGINENVDQTRGNMLSFDGVDDYMEVPNSTSLNDYASTDQLTIEYWVYPKNGDAAQVITAKRTSGNTDGFAIETTGSNAVNHSLYFSSAGWVDLSTTYDLNKWNHIAITYKDGDGFKLYKNGELVTSNALNDNLTSASAVLRLGKDSEYTNARPWNGNLDEFRVWSTARSQTQIRQSMFLTLAGNEANLKAYYQCNHSSGNVIDKINANNGTLNNGASRGTSGVSVAKGTVVSQTVSTAGQVAFGASNVTVDFTSVSSPGVNDEFVVYQLQEAPYNNIAGVDNTTDNYWIIKQFGSQTFEIDQVTFTIPSGGNISATDEATPANLKLYKRSDNSMDADWGGSVFASAQSASNTTKQIVFGSTTVPANGLNMTTLSEFVIGGTNTSQLPIELLSFEAKRSETNSKEVLLQWATLTEEYNAGFEIEMSQDGEHYRKVNFVKGAGNSNSVNNYQLVVNNISAAYYRLKQMDTDGKYSYSPVRFVEGSKVQLSLSSFPNPTQGQVNLKLNNSPKNVVLEIQNMQGTTVLTARGNLAQVNQQLNQHLQRWTNGVYFLNLKSEGRVLRKRLVLNK